MKIPKFVRDVAGVLSGATRAKSQEQKEKLKLRRDREERQMDRRPTSMFPAPNVNLPKGVEQSPRGDIGKHSGMEMKKVFPRKIKGDGTMDHASSYLPYHPEPMQGDTPGISVRSAPKDEVG